MYGCRVTVAYQSGDAGVARDEVGEDVLQCVRQPPHAQQLDWNAAHTAGTARGARASMHPATATKGGGGAACCTASCHCRIYVPVASLAGGIGEGRQEDRKKLVVRAARAHPSPDRSLVRMTSACFATHTLTHLNQLSYTPHRLPNGRVRPAIWGMAG